MACPCLEPATVLGFAPFVPNSSLRSSVQIRDKWALTPPLLTRFHNLLVKRKMSYKSSFHASLAPARKKENYQRQTFDLPYVLHRFTCSTKGMQETMKQYRPPKDPRWTLAGDSCPWDGGSDLALKAALFVMLVCWRLLVSQGNHLCVLTVLRKSTHVFAVGQDLKWEANAVEKRNWNVKWNLK